MSVVEPFDDRAGAASSWSGARRFQYDPRSWLDADTLLTVATRLLALAMSFVTALITARWLQPAGRGEYVLVYTTAQVLAQFGNLGLHSSNTYFVAQQREALGRLLANSLFVAIAAGLLLSLGLAVYWGSAGMSIPGLAVVPVLVPALLLSLFANNLLVGIGAVRDFNRLQLATYATVLTGVVVAAALGATASGFLLATTVAWSGAAAVALICVARHAGVRVRSLRFHRHTMRSSVRYAAKAYVATMFGYLLLRNAVFVLGRGGDFGQIGQYSIAMQVGDALAVVPQSMAMLLFPRLVASRADGWNSVRALTMRLSLVFGGVCLLVAIAAPVAIPAVFGQAFAPAVDATRWALPGVFFAGITALWSQYAAAAGFPLRLVYTWGLGVLVCGWLTWLLVPSMASSGAAAALSLTQLLMCVMVWTVCRGVRTHRQTAGRTPILATL